MLFALPELPLRMVSLLVEAVQSFMLLKNSKTLKAITLTRMLASKLSVMLARFQPRLFALMPDSRDQLLLINSSKKDLAAGALTLQMVNTLR
jgi:hypothetical protein